MNSMNNISVLVITTHPIQYMAPWFQSLAAGDLPGLHVAFLREPTAVQQGSGFGHAFKWDMPLREGYRNVVLDLPEKPTSLLGSLNILRRHIKAVNPNVVLITGWNELLLVLTYPMLKMMGIPVIVRGESNDLRARSRILCMGHRLLLRFVDAAVQIGVANRRFYLKNGLAENVVFNGVYFVNTTHMLHMATSCRGQRGALRKLHGFDDNDFVVAFVGKHVPFKRPMMIIDAARICRHKGLQVRLIFAGSGELTESLKARASEFQVYAAFTGFLNQTEMWKAYLPADAFALPSSNGETWGLVTNEAMLFELPVIVSEQVGCAEDLVIDAETGYVFHGEAEELAESIIRLAADRDKASEMGRAGRKRVTERYSMHVATEGLLEAVGYVLNARRQ
jgi:glycosyltransferase involved in cell wall biosynthesis